MPLRKSAQVLRDSTSVLEASTQRAPREDCEWTAYRLTAAGRGVLQTPRRRADSLQPRWPYAGSFSRRWYFLILL